MCAVWQALMSPEDRAAALASMCDTDRAAALVSSDRGEGGCMIAAWMDELRDDVNE